MEPVDNLQRIQQLENWRCSVDQPMQADQQAVELSDLEKLMLRAARIEKLISFGSIPQAEQEARHLYIESLEYTSRERTKVFNQQDSSIYIPNIPTQAAFKCVEIVIKPEIQFDDDLKYQMSKVCTVLLEHSLLVIEHNKRMICASKRDQLWVNLSEVLGFLPGVGQRTRFELKCCLGSIHRMIPTGERLQAVAKEHGPEVVKGVAAAGASLSAGPLVAPIVDALAATFKELPSIWYNEIFEMKQHYWKVLHENKNKDNPLPPITLELAKSRQAVCLAQIFDRIVKDPQSSPELRQRVFNGRDQSKELDQDIVSLSRCKGYWKARFFSIKTLIELIPELNVRGLKVENKITLENQEVETIHALADALIREKKKKIHDLIYSAYYWSEDKQKLVWRKRINTHKPNVELLNEIKEINLPKIKLLQTQIERLEATLNSVKSEINKKLKREVDQTVREERIDDVILGPIMPIPEPQRVEGAKGLQLHSGSKGAGLDKEAIEEQAKEFGLEAPEEEDETEEAVGAEEGSSSEKSKREEAESASIELLEQELLESKEKLLEAKLKILKEELEMRLHLQDVQRYKDQPVKE